MNGTTTKRDGGTDGNQFQREENNGTMAGSAVLKPSNILGRRRLSRTGRKCFMFCFFGRFLANKSFGKKQMWGACGACEARLIAAYC